ncbi:MAG: CAP domain-containing protein [Actinobacteria bacterium]|nr:CAP domain-containing protein [Actinomycetota bacterium]
MHTYRNPRARALAFVSLFLAATLATPALSASAEDAATPEPPVASTITTNSPTSGLEPGGAVVTITGTGFTGTTSVAFGSVAATKFTVVSDTRITAISPELDADSYQLAVTTAAGTTTAGAFVVRSYADEVLRLVNDARGTKRKCGSTTYKAVPKLRADATLAKVATAHSKDMAAHSFFSHSSRNGDSPFDRMGAAGYKYSSAGENIAAGYRTPSSVVKAWLKSKGHCKNIMKRSYTELGVGYAEGGYYGTYWTQDFGNPR